MERYRRWAYEMRDAFQGLRRDLGEPRAYERSADDVARVLEPSHQPVQLSGRKQVGACSDRLLDTLVHPSPSRGKQKAVGAAHRDVAHRTQVDPWLASRVKIIYISTVVQKLL